MAGTGRRTRFLYALVFSGIALLVASIWVLGRGDRQTIEAETRTPPTKTVPAPAELAAVDPARAAAPNETRETIPADRANVDATPAPRMRAEEGPFRARLLDVATDEPIGFLEAVAGDERAEVDGQGYFRFPSRPSAKRIEFYDRFQNTHIRWTLVADMQAEGELWIARIAIGPTYPLEIVGVDSEQLEPWRARLVEVRPDGTRREGGWLRIRPESPAFARYDNPWEAEGPDHTYVLEAHHTEEGLLGSSAPLLTTVGIHPSVVTIRIEERLASLSGRVINMAGEGVRRTNITVMPLRAGERSLYETDWVETYSNIDGTFSLGGLAPGTYRVHARPRRGEPPQSRTVEIFAGQNRIEDFVIPVQEPAGRIEGRLRNRSGRPFGGRQLVRLRAADGRGFELFDISSTARQRRDPRLGRRPLQPHTPSSEPDNWKHDHVFEFAAVPAGTYELSVVAMDVYDWSPAQIEVTPPDKTIEFVREDDADTVPFVFEILAADTGTPLEEARIHLRQGDVWFPNVSDGMEFDFPPDARFTWTAFAPGYRARAGDQSAFRIEGSQARARIELEPGWSVRLHFRDIQHGFGHDDEHGLVAVRERPPVAGVRVLADGVPRATSNEQGLAEIALDRKPDRVEFDTGPWLLARSDRIHEGRLLIEGPGLEIRDVVVWLVAR